MSSKSELVTGAQPKTPAEHKDFMVLELPPEEGEQPGTTRVRYDDWPEEYYFEIYTYLDEKVMVEAERRANLSTKIGSNGQSSAMRDELERQRTVIRHQLTDMRVPYYNRATGRVEVLTHTKPNVEKVLRLIGVRAWLFDRCTDYMGLISTARLETANGAGATF
jgi:hypothetical protein